MTKRTMRWIAQGAALSVCLVGKAGLAQDTGAVDRHEPGKQVVNIPYDAVKWQKLMPELGERSPETAILHVDPQTKATQMLLRVPKDTHVPLHWHSTNETHTVVKGTFIVECDGQREVLNQGSFNFMPAKMHHEAWTRPDEGALVFVTLSGAFDFQWVNGPPKAADIVGGTWR